MIPFEIPRLKPGYFVFGGGYANELAYQMGFHGAFIDYEELPDWARRIARWARDKLRRNARCELRAENAIARDLHGIGSGKRAVHFRHAMQIDPSIHTGNQDAGNCTPWMTREMVGDEWCADIAERGEAQEYVKRPGTAVVYGSRGHSGAGMDLATAMDVVHNRGIQLEISYLGGKYDLSTEARDEAAGVAWGRSGPPADLLAEIAGDRIEQVSLVTDEQAIKDLLFMGHFLGHGSTRTARSSGDPIAPLQTIGGHAQEVMGYDDTDEFRDFYRERTGKTLNDWVAIHDQSWGDWNTITNWPDHLWGPKPEGAWVITGSDLMRIVREWGDCWAISNVLGFPMRTLPDWGGSAVF